MTAIDLTPIVTAMVSLAAAIITAGTPIIAAAAVRRLHIAQGSAAEEVVRAACETGAGIAYDALVAQAHRPASIEIRNTAVATGLQHVLDAVPDAIKRTGVTQDTITRMVTGKLGALLARDATVSPGPSVTVPPPALPAP